MEKGGEIMLAAAATQAIFAGYSCSRETFREMNPH
jgi:hypothetical protein